MASLTICTSQASHICQSERVLVDADIAHDVAGTAYQAYGVLAFVARPICQLSPTHVKLTCLCLRTQAHGVLMTVAWTIILPISIVIASTMRTTLKPGLWFQIHRALGVCLWGIALPQAIALCMHITRQELPVTALLSIE